MYHIATCVLSHLRGDSSAKGRRVWAGGIEPTDNTFSNPKATDSSGNTAPNIEANRS